MRRRVERGAPMIDRELALRIRLVGLDVDGVLTDGGIYIGDVSGERLEFKRYDIQDGLGVLLLRSAGIKVVIVTGRVSESVKLRAEELRADDLAQDELARKLPAFQKILERHDISPDEAAFIGDDFPDLAILRIVGLPVAVGNAVPEIKSISQLKLERHGGRGAVREFAEILLRARGEWERVTEDYVASRSKAMPELVR
ncbi:MAG TPA: HAD hydrolase family protein [Gemmatimonadaceae bacterium]|nr:HAD hydrolase family protein [Gemmatimonadaceae bacterium]